MNAKRLIRPISFAAYFIAAFLLFFFLRLPYDRIKTRIESEVRQRTSLDLSIGRISPRVVNRFRLTDVSLSNRSGQVLLESPSLTASISMLNLLRGVVALDLDAKAYGGELLASAKIGRNQRQFELHASDLDLARYSLFSATGINLGGKLGGSFDMTGDSGALKAQVKGMTSRGLTIKGFPVPDLDFDRCWLDANIRGGRLSLKKLELEGKELNINCGGDIALGDRGGMNLLFRLKPSERLNHEQAGILSLFKTRDADGFYQFGLGGTLSEPALRL